MNKSLENQIENMIDGIIGENIHILINHQFGNQVIQSVITSWNDISEIMLLIKS